jgi:hypothetical protein
VSDEDPFAVLGLPREATLADVRAARRRLAKELHPDHGGDEARMREVNAAFEAAVAHLTGRRPLPRRPAEPRPPAPAPGRWQQDLPSFVVEALPVEAFEALLVVTSWIGEVLVDDPPYVLEVHLHDPAPCWCRLDLVPDAGATTVSLVVAAVGDDPAPAVEDVRDTWVAGLNQLVRWDPNG